jgi:hypothetical protein
MKSGILPEIIAVVALATSAYNIKGALDESYDAGKATATSQLIHQQNPLQSKTFEIQANSETDDRNYAIVVAAGWLVLSGGFGLNGVIKITKNRQKDKESGDTPVASETISAQ